MSDSQSHSEKLIAIGDVHGCSRTLNSLLGKLEAWPDHLLVFVGDYIDRGPKSKEVISRLIQLRGERECVFLRGNHEEMLLNAVDKGEISSWLINGGGTMLFLWRSYGVQSSSADRLITMRERIALPSTLTRLYFFCI